MQTCVKPQYVLSTDRNVFIASTPVQKAGVECLVKFLLTYFWSDISSFKS